MGVEERLARLTAHGLLPDNEAKTGDEESAHDALIRARLRQALRGKLSLSDAGEDPARSVHGHTARGKETRSRTPSTDAETPADIAQAAASVKGEAYTVMMAVGTEDPFSMMKATRYAELWSWRQWWERERQAQINVKLNRKLAELAMLWMVDPSKMRAAGAKGLYTYCRVDPRTWASSYNDHFSALLRHLQDLEARGKATFRRALG